MTRAIIVPEAEGERIGVPGTEIVIKIRSQDSDGQFAVFEEVNEPGLGPPTHIHDKQWEMFRFLEGSHKVRIGEETFEAEANAIAVVPPGTPHGFLVVGSSIGRVQFILYPGLQIEEYFKRFAKIMSETGDFDAIRELAKQYHQTFLGELLTP